MTEAEPVRPPACTAFLMFIAAAVSQSCTWNPLPPSEAGPPEPVQLLGQRERTLGEDLPLDQALLPQGHGEQVLSGLSELLRPGAVDGPFSPGRGTVRAVGTGGTAALGRSVLDSLGALDVGVSGAASGRQDRGRRLLPAARQSAHGPRCPCAYCRSG
jgi:hypothetical protein